MIGFILRLLRGDDATAALCQMIVALLRSEPEQWTFDKFHAEHKSGIRVWIANRVYGLHVEHGRGLSPAHITPRWWWRRQIYLAARAHRSRAIQAEMIRSYREIRDNVVAIRQGPH